MIWKVGKIFMKGSLIILGILCIINVPALFIYEGELSFQPFLYIYQIVATIKGLFQLKDLTYIDTSQFGYPFSPSMLEAYGFSISGLNEYPLLPSILERYGYSLSLLGISFVVSLLLASVLSYIYLISSPLLKKCLKQVLLVLESLPDVMVIVIIQIFFIWLFQETRWMPFTIFAFQEEQPYVLPIICLSLLPTIQLFRFLIIHMEDEESKPYVELLRGKGLGKSYIIMVHLFRNVMIHLFYHSKSIFLFMISNLFVLEYVFNVDGLMKFLLDNGVQNPIISFLIICLMFIPFFLCFQVISIFVNRINVEGGEVN